MQGIQKIRDVCKILGADDPEYIVHGEDIMVKFSALQSAKVSDAKALNVTKDVSIEVKILALLKENASITTTDMARQLSVNRRTIQRGLEVLKSRGTIERKGGKRYGYWKFTNSFCIPIVPFPDGNGRVGRLIALKECLRFGLIPFIIEDDKKCIITGISLNGIKAI